MNKEKLEEQINKLEDQIFYHEMKDHWTKEDFDLAEELELELSILKEKLVKKGNEQNDNNREI